MPPVGRTRRNPADAWMPPRVYRGRSAFEFRPKGGGAVRLAPLTATPREVLAALARLNSDAAPGSVAALLEDAAASAWFAGLATWTQRGYRRAFVQLRKVFGHMPALDLRPEHIRRWLDARADAKSVYVANREFGALAGVCRWGYERGWLVVNPCKGVRRFREQPRDRKVMPAELAAFADLCSPRLRAYLALRMVVPLRQGELLALPLAALRAPDGIPVDEPSKGGIPRTFAWTEARRLAADAVLALDPPARTFTWPGRRDRRTGQVTPFTQHGFQSEWTRVMARYVATGGIRFHEHDLRAAATEELALEHAQLALGHQSIATTRRHYRRRSQIVP